MMKHITAIACLSMVMMTSCNFLDFDESEGKTKEEAYGYFENVTSLVAAAYRELPKDYGVVGGALRESATDNSVVSWQMNPLNDMYNDVWSPRHLVDNYWNKFYPVIYDINSFLENYSEEQLERFKDDPNYKDNIEKCKNSINEVRALRAFYYFEMIKRFKDVPLLKNTCSLEEVNHLDKTKFKDVLSFMVSEWDEVADKLPLDYDTFFKETGRVTKGAVLAFKSRALLYAASPLFAEFSGVTWEEAAKAALDVINLNVYSLPRIIEDPLYVYDTGHKALTSPQLIFEFRESSETNEFERRNLPPTFTPGVSKGMNNPTQNLVDAFEFKNGDIFDWNNSEHVRKIYYDDNGDETRDPRLYLNVLCNGMTYMKKNVETYVGGMYGPQEGNQGYTLTGYYLKKLLNEAVSLDPVKQVKKPHHYPGYRYAEILLNYAEALNEWKGPDYTDAVFTLSAREALNQVRLAAGMPDVVASDQDEFRERVRNERRVELAFEDHRFWDIRRWKTGEVVKDIYGISINNSYGKFSYKKEKIQTRVWDDKMYFYPIPQSEVFVNPKLKQNSGW